MAFEQDQRISRSGQPRAGAVAHPLPAAAQPDPRDAEEIIQDVFYELVEANRLLMPIEHVTGWLYRVARNRIIDLFRKKRPESFSGIAVADSTRPFCSQEDSAFRLTTGQRRFIPQRTAR